MKILILANNDLGLYNFRAELIEKLIELNYEVYISLPKGPKVEKLEKIGCKYIESNLDRRGINPIKDLKLMFSYIKIIKNIKPEYVLTYTIKPNVYGGIACRLKKVKQIANITGLGTALENTGILQKIAVFLHKIALKNVYCCFAQNEENLKFLKNHKIANNKLKLIPGSGVNLEKYKLLNYPTEDQTIEFLFISRIMKEKGIDQYLEMAEYIKSKYNNTRFHILGFCEQEYNEKLNELQNRNIIEYHGRQDNIIPFMKKASCVIHPTYYPEGMSNVLLEACASGRPVITTNRPGCKEIVDNGVNGYIIEEKNSKDLIEKVEKFINLPNEEKKQMGLAGRKKVENEFDRKIIIQEYINEIQKPKNNNIRILHVLGGLNRGGAETMVMNLYRNIDRNKIQFDFIKHTKDKCAFDDEIINLGGRIYSMPQYKLYNHFQYKRAWENFFKEHQEYKIIHGHVRSTATIYLKIAKKYGLYAIAHSHSTSSGKSIKAIVKNILQYKIRYIADYFMGCSKEANEWLFGKKVANSDKCIVLNNGIDINKFSFNNQVRNEMRHRLNIKDNEIVIGHVGRFVEVKNHKFIFKLFSMLYDNNNKYRLLLVGDGPEKKKIIKKCKKQKCYENIIFTGAVNNVNDYMQAMDVFILPSKYEGLGMVLIEAQTNGLKCIASQNIPKETNISDNIQFLPLKNNYWKNAILDLDFTRREIKTKALRENYDIINIAKNMEKIYFNINKNL